MQEQILLAGSTEKSRMLLQTLLPPGTNPPPRMCMSERCGNPPRAGRG